MSLRRFSLESSLKPFCFDMSDKGFRAVVAKIFRQWESLYLDSDIQVELLFWSSDGSELLEYTGDFADQFEYARYVGGANSGRRQHSTPLHLRNLNERNYLFMPDPPQWTYGDLRRLVGVCKQTFRNLYGRNLEVGTTFDPGPEFAISDFKYKYHREILSPSGVFVRCAGTLHTDNRRYAGYPSGIPDGETFGRFLGRQTQHFLTDIGFDYIWLSNGFGFGTEPWHPTGALFDGKKFYGELAPALKETQLRFWRDFRAECPQYRIEMRGTNLSTGLDIASDAVPIREIYREVPFMEAPPNSPWAAINRDFGMELAGWMSHIAELPSINGFPFRFYIHDPWWHNSPWLDRYGRMPYDIYLPLAVARLNHQGVVETPSHLELLSVDNSHGETPDQVPLEVIPHMQEALRTLPDQCGLLVWVYPFEEFHDQIGSGENPDAVFAADVQMIAAINCGLPLNTVISSTDFLHLPSATLTGRILAAPTTVAPAVLQRLREFAAAGGGVLLYGPPNRPDVLDHLELEEVPGLENDLTLSGRGRICHNAVFSGGQLNTTLKSGSRGEELLYYLGANGEKRTAVAKYGNLIYLRGSSSFFLKGGQVEYLPESENFPFEKLYLEMLGHFGYEFTFELDGAPVESPTQTLHLHDNAFFLNNYSRNSAAVMHLRFPDGAPVFTGHDVRLRDNRAVYPMEKSGHNEIRFFVSGEDSVISCEECATVNRGIHRTMRLLGLKNAIVVFRPPEDIDTVVFRLQDSLYPSPTLFMENNCEVEECRDAFGRKFIITGITGTLMVMAGVKPDLENW